MAKTVGCVGSSIVFEGRRILLTRRAYPGSRAVFTWVDVLSSGGWVSLGDPWPSGKVSEAEIRAELDARGL